MSYLLDILGATAVGMFVIFMILQVNIRINDSSNEIFLSSLAQNDALTSAQIIQNDFYKVGYRKSGSAVALADSNQMKFYADIDNNGNVDSVFYSVGLTSFMINTPNPNDRPLYRTINTGNPQLVSIVSDFELTYFDSSGSELNYASLATPANRDLITTIQVFITFESADKVNDYYQGIDWLRVIRPKNI